MAGEDLYGALAGLTYDPAETGYGTSSQVLASSLPALMNPYQGAGTNIGIALGGALISGLLGYQARQSAAEQSLAANRLGLQLLEAQSPQARLGIIESAPDALMQEKLLGVNTRLAAQQAAIKQLVDQEVAKRTGLAEFELGPTGTKLFEREIDKVRRETAIRAAALRSAASSSISGAVDEKIDPEDKKLSRYAIGAERLAEQFEDLNMNAAEFEAARKIPGSKADLAYSALMGQLPNLARLGGQSAQISDLDTKQQMASVFGPTIFDQTYSGTESIAARIRQKIKTAPFSPGFNPFTAQTSTPAPLETRTGVSPEISMKIKAIDTALSKPGVTQATRSALLAKKEELMK